MTSSNSIFDTGIRPIIDAYLAEQAAQVRDYGDYWSASSAGYCMRKLIFERLGVPPVTERDPRLTRVFESGHIFHSWLQGITKKAGISIAQEDELQNEELMIRGHFDDLVLVSNGKEDGKHIVLYDFKTQNSRAFSYQKDKAMNYYHHMQLATYLYLLRHQTNLSKLYRYPIHLIEESRILKISKDDLRMSEDILLWDDKLEKEVVDYWTELNKWWNDKLIPPCTCADHEGGFLATEKFNPFFYDGEPCSLKWYKEWKNASTTKS